MTGLDRLWIRDGPGLAGSLRWYREVATNHQAAKFRIAATIAARVPLRDAYAHARRLGLRFETISFENRTAERHLLAPDL